HHLDICRIGLRSTDLHEAAAHLFHDEFVAETGSGIEFAVMPRSFEELQHQHAHAVADRAQCRAHGSGRLTLARAGLDDDEAFACRRQVLGSQFSVLRKPTFSLGTENRELRTIYGPRDTDGL